MKYFSQRLYTCVYLFFLNIGLSGFFWNILLKFGNVVTNKCFFQSTLFETEEGQRLDHLNS